ncbi:DUF6843 domain-containing protein [Paenibacillus sp.]|uniref:DUF6843 domain-containing protein n=1 Tax=Paenibacillus sp. TaxID=58172 RepID=UPI002810A711|nr:hypothetical protein [Paenibacillus sp.]
MKFPLLVFLSLAIVMGCLSQYNRGTYDLYLIPQNFEGVIRVIYNVEGAPSLNREGKFDIIPVDEDGMYRTSNPMFDYGTVIDKYYYVDNLGNRTEIDRSCVNVRGTGGSVINGIETHHTEIEVTRSECGEDFMLEGSALH